MDPFCSGGVPARARLGGPTAGEPSTVGDTVAAMGFVKQSLAVRSFLVVVGCLCEGDWEGESCFVFPPKGCRGERCGFQGAQSPAGSAWMVFLSERFLFFLPGEAFFTPTGNLLSASERKEWRRLHYDVFGSGRGTGTLNLQSGCFWYSATVARVRRSKAFLKG